MNSISANLNVMIKAAEKASKVLIRDFGEIEKLQVSKKGPSDFVTNSDLKTEKIIIEELKKARPNYSIISEENGVQNNKDQIKDNEILLFMKGSPYQPQCGFSSKVAQILFSYDIEFSYIDVLEFPEVRANLPKISEWPTFPQLFVKGELVGGCDIVSEMHESKELESVFNPQQ